MFKTVRPISSRMFSIGLQQGDEELPIQEATYSKFQSCNYTFFYHSRTDKSARDSTKYRHAPITGMDPWEDTDILRQSSIGFDIEPQEWKYAYLNSKFCLVIRGDNPQSNAFLRAIRVGCIPVVVSDYFARYAPMFRDTLNNISEFALFVDEQTFLNHPGQSLRNIMDLDTSRVQQLMKGMQFAQRVLLPDHPQSLFVPAFFKQAWLSMSEEERKQRPQVFGKLLR